NLTLAVKDRHRHDFLPANAERTDDLEQFELRETATLRGRRIKNVEERPSQILQRRRVAVARHRPLMDRVEAADVVEAHDVIGVTVREYDGVHPAHVEGQR